MFIALWEYRPNLNFPGMNVTCRKLNTLAFEKKSQYKNTIAKTD